MNVVIYARFSSSGQREESIEGQVKVCTEYAENNDYTVIGTYVDRALTCRNYKRPDLQRLLSTHRKKVCKNAVNYGKI